MSETAKKTLADLVAVMAALRTPVTGCPWDLEQNFATIAPYTIEEAYEVADAIAQGDLNHLKEELGDLLLQVVYHSRMAEEDGAFALADVIDGITTKMIRRHPHVFGDDAARSAGAAKGFWEKIKAEEKAAKGARGKPASLLDDVPVGLPALTRAHKLQSKAAKVGFDWPSLGPGLRQAQGGDGRVGSRRPPRRSARRGASRRRRRTARKSPRSWATSSSSSLTSRATSRSIRRRVCAPPTTSSAAASGISRRRLAADGRTPDQSDLAEMDRLWDEAKAKERGG